MQEQRGQYALYQEEDTAWKGATNALPFLNPAHHVGHPPSFTEGYSEGCENFLPNVCKRTERPQQVPQSTDQAGDAGEGEMALSKF